MGIVYVFAIFGAIVFMAIAYGLWLTRGLSKEMARNPHCPWRRDYQPSRFQRWLWDTGAPAKPDQA